MGNYPYFQFPDRRRPLGDRGPRPEPAAPRRPRRPSREMEALPAVDGIRGGGGEQQQGEARKGEGEGRPGVQFNRHLGCGLGKGLGRSFQGDNSGW